jgi:hypothetical protein
MSSDPDPKLLLSLPRRDGQSVRITLESHRGRPYVRLSSPGGTVTLKLSELADVAGALLGVEPNAPTPVPGESATPTPRASKDAPGRGRRGAYGPREEPGDGQPLLDDLL